jgi:hypothetical protein
LFVEHRVTRLREDLLSARRSDHRGGRLFAYYPGMRGKALPIPSRETSRGWLTLVWRLASGAECRTWKLDDGRTYVEVRWDEKRRCSGLFEDPVTAAEWADVAHKCFTRHGCWAAGPAFA